MLKLFCKKEKICNHDQNVRIEKYFSIDGTPMIKIECFCGYTDNGYVYADANEWEESVIVKRNGIITINEKKRKINNLKSI